MINDYFLMINSNKTTSIKMFAEKGFVQSMFAGTHSIGQQTVYSGDRSFIDI